MAAVELLGRLADVIENKLGARNAPQSREEKLKQFTGMYPTEVDVRAALKNAEENFIILRYLLRSKFKVPYTPSSEIEHFDYDSPDDDTIAKMPRGAVRVPDYKPGPLD